MTLAPRLQVRQTQTQALVITPQLMQAIRLLQMSGAELERFIDAEIEKNPLLARGEAGEEAAPSRLSGETDAPRAAEAPLPVAGAAPPASRSQASAEDLPDLGALPAPEMSLPARCEIAIDAAFPDQADRFVARALLAQLDEAGYLTVPLDEIAATVGAPLRDAERVLARCQGFGPTGIFARSLAECLSLQLAERGRLDPPMQALLANLDFLARRDFVPLARICGVGGEALRGMVEELKRLDPKPGRAQGGDIAPAIVPDILVRSRPGGGWSVELNGETLPRVLIDNAYAAEISGALDKPGQAFLADCARQANWLTRSLDQRARTILKVAAEIVRHQDGFLACGVSRLRPLTLRAVADAIGVHESTVSRAAAGKFMATPRGTVELKFFFSTALGATGGGEAHSSESVKARIRALVANERASGVLSDDAIVALLAQGGVEIARRTVAKYREMMGIPSSPQRRRDKGELRRRAS